MIALLLLATSGIAPSYNHRLLGAGAPALMAVFARDLRACGYRLIVRPWRDGDIKPKPNYLRHDTLVALADQPIDVHSPKLQCYLKAETRMLQSKRH